MSANGGLLRVLKTPCWISQAWSGPGGMAPATDEFTAIWDTGATNTVITQAVVDACGLVATGMTTVFDASGPRLRETFLVSVGLPNRVRFQSLRATLGTLRGADVLIGMDIIGRGDFAVTNFKGATKFSFRIPSQRHIDFVAESRKEAALEPAAKRGGKKGVRAKRAKPDRKRKKK